MKKNLLLNEMQQKQRKIKINEKQTHSLGLPILKGLIRVWKIDISLPKTELHRD